MQCRKLEAKKKSHSQFCKYTCFFANSHVINYNQCEKILEHFLRLRTLWYLFYIHTKNITSIFTSKKGLYTYTTKMYKQCISVKNSHFFSYTNTYTNISVASSIYFYCLYKKIRITLRIQKQFHIPIKYLIKDIYKIWSDSSGHFEKKYCNVTILSWYMYTKHSSEKRLLYIYHDAIYQLYTNQKWSFLVACGIENTFGITKKAVYWSIYQFFFVYRTYTNISKIWSDMFSHHQFFWSFWYTEHIHIPNIYHTYTKLKVLKNHIPTLIPNEILQR